MKAIKNWDYSLVEYATELAFELHKGQLDKSGVDYFYHPETVSNIVVDLCPEIFTESEVNYCISLGLCHDLLEDCDVTFEHIENEFVSYFADCLNTLTRYENQSYMEYIKLIDKNKYTRLIKMADIIHNSNLDRLRGKFTVKDIERNQKYMKALKYLIENGGKM